MLRACRKILKLRPRALVGESGDVAAEEPHTLRDDRIRNSGCRSLPLTIDYLSSHLLLMSRGIVGCL